MKRLARAVTCLVVLAACLASCGSGRGVGAGDAGSDDSAAHRLNVEDADFGTCFSLCPSSDASVVLSCPAVVTSMQTSGTCMDTGTCTPKKPGPCATFRVGILPTQAGACEVDVSLADGSRYTAQLIFVEMPASRCCGATLVPEEQSVTIDNPPSTCVDPWDAAAGVAIDAGTVSDAEAGSGEESDGDRGWDAVTDLAFPSVRQ